jgi:soluble lytic murein transglycosylase-like protein
MLISMMFVALPGGVAANEEHIVKPGDTLSEIAEQYGFSLQELIWLNGIDDPDMIFPGEQIVLAAPGNEWVAEATVAEEPVVAEEEAWVEVPQGGTGLPPYFDQWDIEWLIEFYANEYGWDPNLIKAQAWQESYWRQDEISWTGAIGVMQIMPGTAAEMNDWYFGRDRDVWYSAEDNIEMGVAYLSVLYEETGSVRLALASYYQGWWSVQNDGMFPDTKQYVRRIMRFQEQFANGQLP